MDPVKINKKYNEVNKRRKTKYKSEHNEVKKCRKTKYNKVNNNNISFTYYRW
jgi:hypothetical protein